MNKIWIITRRELSAFFDSLIAYVLIVIFLGLSGFFTWLFGNNVFVIGQASLQVFFQIGFWTLFFFIPALTMKMLAEETKSGTIELLSTKAVTDWQIVTGKFLACWLLVAIALVATLPYYMTVSQLGTVDHGAIVGGYLGLLFLSAGYISIGIFASSITNNQIVAFLFALLIGIFFQLLFDVMGFNFRGLSGAVFNYLSMRTHFDSLSRGVIDSRDLIYFASVVLAGLTVSQAMLSRRNWQS
ncbi:ABC transporter permease subunit [Reichenbachiella agarivorans]|uniref:ABC transporter permease subunit n=1 Tax=Reichenbachiella agarivorans TaxID=2979464 RepID=A0ABY6CPV4_9BACT|nr:ABC transporter permease subunit [Reichenbachiella agarivorans]UXP31393.1 ABC transporter permease subunit [Reichenbachiella agarivorans]